MKRTVAAIVLPPALAALAAFAGCAARIEPMGGYPATLAIESMREHRECLELLPGEVLAYEFSSTDAVDFSIHPFTVDGPAYSLRRSGLLHYSGLFAASKNEFYCLTWTNRNVTKPLVLGYGLEILRQ